MTDTTPTQSGSKNPKEPVFRPFLTLQETAQTLGITPSTCYRMCRQGRIKSKKLGTSKTARYIIHINDLAEFVASLPSGEA